jgi:hypothetical protein
VRLHLWPAAKTNPRQLLGVEGKKCPMNSDQLACGVVVNEARVLEPLPKKGNARPCSPHHPRQLTNLRNIDLGRSLLIKMGQQRKNPRESLLAWIATPINQDLRYATYRGVAPVHQPVALGVFYRARWDSSRCRWMAISILEHLNFVQSFGLQSI